MYPPLNPKGLINGSRSKLLLTEETVISLSFLPCATQELMIGADKIAPVASEAVLTNVLLLVDSSFCCISAKEFSGKIKVFFNHIHGNFHFFNMRELLFLFAKDVILHVYRDWSKNI